MARPKKDWVKLTLSIDKKVDEELRKYCEETGLPLTVAVERFIKKGLCENDEESK